MFGGADSCRKQYGTLKDGDLPAIREYMTQVHQGTCAPSTLGRFLIQRTGKSLSDLWMSMAGLNEHARIPFHRVPERLAACGTGILAPHELGQLQMLLRPAADGSVGYEEWSAAFSLSGAELIPTEVVPTAGMSTAESNARHDYLPHMRMDGVRHGESSVPTSYRPASQQWPGGWVQQELEYQEGTRSVASNASTVERARTPFATDADCSHPPPTAPTMAPPSAT